MVLAFLNGNWEESRRLQLKYLDLVDALFCEVNPIPVKAAVSLMGYKAGGVRLPLTEIEENHRVYLKQEMEKVGLC